MEYSTPHYRNDSSDSGICLFGVRHDLLEIAMSALHKKKANHEECITDTRLVARPEEFAYEADVTEEALDILRQMASETISNGHWIVIDGYAPKEKSVG